MMTTKKHTLTTGKDTMTGVSGSDLFNAATGTLNNNDVLNGGGGNDTIKANISGNYLTPTMKNIENGIFTHSGSAFVGLDLAKSQQMTSVALDDFKSDVSIRNADSVKKISIDNIDTHTAKISGIDTKKSLTETISILDSKDLELNIQTDKSALLHTIDITLNNSKVYLQGDLSVTELNIHSISKGDNTLLYDADSSLQSIQKVTVDGSAKFDFGITETYAFRSMKAFDASEADGAVSTQFDGTKLDYVRGGSDMDSFYFYDIGGTTAKKASVNMGAAADFVGMTAQTFDSNTMVINGGDGVDTFSYNGVDHGLAAGLKSFETLAIENLGGTYKLDGDFKTLKLSDATSYGDGVLFKGGTALTRVYGSVDHDDFTLDALGGTVAAKATVELGKGDDFLRLDHLVLNTATQHFDGGSGHDGFSIFGNVADVGATFGHFEYVYMYNMHGTYDFTGSGINTLIFGNVPAGAMTLKGLETGSVIQIGAPQTTIMTVNIEDAASSKVESLVMDLYGNADFGNSSFGLIAPDLSNLIVDSSQSAHTMYLTELGSDIDYATLYATGSSKINFVASTGSTMYIDEVRSTNTAGMNMLGLLNANALTAAGVTIVGGGGSDVLVGGKGWDNITSGGGNNDIHGSLGKDIVNITGGGLDELIFHTFDQSRYGLGDSIKGFNLFDAIDISDVVSSVTFNGNFNSLSAGNASLSSGHTTAFFDTANHTLYVDVNGDGALSTGHDMEFYLQDLASFNSNSLIG